MKSAILFCSVLAISSAAAAQGEQVLFADAHVEPMMRPAQEPAAIGAAQREFDLSLTATVPAPETPAKRLDLWIPAPSSNGTQTITAEKADSPFPCRFETEETYGNRVLHAWIEPAQAGKVVLQFHCVRRLGSARRGDPAPATGAAAPPARLLQADRLGVIDDRIRDLARQITAGAADTSERSRAIYAYVVGHMDYDKTVAGWGNGDTIRACDVGKGNCTDFHALFISLARASGIPARFDIGFALPEEKSSGAIAGYHCWAEFWDEQAGWTPVDCSEARQRPERQSFYFGGLTASRVQLSTGRDVTLPGMHGPALNYFLAPYAEADGQPLAGVERQVSFAETGNTQ